MRTINLLMLIFLSNSINAQLCDNNFISHEKMREIKKLIRTFDTQKNYDGELPIIRLTLNNVVRTDGTDGFAWSDIRDRVSDLSELFNNQICFTVIEENTIADDDYFGTPTRVGGVLTQEYIDLIEENQVDNAIRLYFVDEAGSGGRATGFLFDNNQTTDDPTVYLSDGFEGLDNNDNPIFVNTFTSEVLAHEIGHVLGLWHTHTVINGVENVARTGANANCDENGDLLCDTPADPGLVFLLNDDVGDIPSCTYVGNFTDPTGANYDPLTDNIMSYTHPTCMESLTTGQINRCLDFIQQTTELDDIVIPEIIDIQGTLSDDRYYHADEDIVSSVEHTGGIVDYRARETITLKPGFHVTASSSSEFSARIDDNLCHDELINNSGLVEDDISTRKKNQPLNNSIKIYPNPAQDIISIEIQTNVETTLTVFDINGNIIKVETINKSFHQVNVYDFPKGIYVFQFTTGEQTKLERVVIQ